MARPHPDSIFSLDQMRWISRALALLIFLTGGPLCYCRETNYWHERRAYSLAGTNRTRTSQGGDSPDQPDYFGGMGGRDAGLSLDPSIPGEVRRMVGSLPPSMGWVTNSHVPPGTPSRRWVIHIQDVHGNLPAQKQIAAILASLSSSASVDAIALEGTEGDIDLRRYQEFGSRRAVEMAADALLKSNHISGPIYGSLTGRARTPLVGVEDWALYRQNTEAYLAAARELPSVREGLAKQRALLEEEKSRVYSPNLLTFDRATRAYRTGQMGLEEYVSTYIPGRTSAIQDVVDWSQLINAPKTDHHHLRRLAQRLDHLRAGGPGALEEDIRRRQEDMYRRGAITPRQNELVVKSRALDLAEGLARFSLTPRQWRQYETWPGEFPFPSVWPCEEFYRQARARDEAMARRLVNEFRGRNGPQTLLWVAGGFHGPGVSRWLNDNGIGTIAIVPKIDGMISSSGGEALRFFLRQNPLDGLLVEAQGLAPPPIKKSVLRVLLPALVTLGVMALGADVSAGIDASTIYSSVLAGAGTWAGFRAGEAVISYRNKKIRVAGKIDTQSQKITDARWRISPNLRALWSRWIMRIMATSLAFLLVVAPHPPRSFSSRPIFSATSIHQRGKGPTGPRSQGNVPKAVEELYKLLLKAASIASDSNVGSDNVEIRLLRVFREFVVTASLHSPFASILFHSHGIETSLKVPWNGDEFFLEDPEKLTRLIVRVMTIIGDRFDRVLGDTSFVKDLLEMEPAQTMVIPYLGDHFETISLKMPLKIMNWSWLVLPAMEGDSFRVGYLPNGAKWRAQHVARLLPRTETVIRAERGRIQLTEGEFHQLYLDMLIRISLARIKQKIYADQIRTNESELFLPITATEEVEAMLVAGGGLWKWLEESTMEDIVKSTIATNVAAKIDGILEHLYYVRSVRPEAVPLMTAWIFAELYFSADYPVQAHVLSPAGIYQMVWEFVVPALSPENTPLQRNEVDAWISSLLAGDIDIETELTRLRDNNVVSPIRRFLAIYERYPSSEEFQELMSCRPLVPQGLPATLPTPMKKQRYSSWLNDLMERMRDGGIQQVVKQFDEISRYISLNDLEDNPTVAGLIEFNDQVILLRRLVSELTANPEQGGEMLMLVEEIRTQLCNKVLEQLVNDAYSSTNFEAQASHLDQISNCLDNPKFCETMGEERVINLGLALLGALRDLSLKFPDEFKKQRLAEVWEIYRPDNSLATESNIPSADPGGGKAIQLYGNSIYISPAVAKSELWVNHRGDVVELIAKILSGRNNASSPVGGSNFLGNSVPHVERKRLGNAHRVFYQLFPDEKLVAIGLLANKGDISENDSGKINRRTLGQLYHMTMGESFQGNRWFNRYTPLEGPPRPASLADGWARGKWGERSREYFDYTVYEAPLWEWIYAVPGLNLWAQWGLADAVLRKFFDKSDGKPVALPVYGQTFLTGVAVAALALSLYWGHGASLFISLLLWGIISGIVFSNAHPDRDEDDRVKLFLFWWSATILFWAPLLLVYWADPAWLVGLARWAGYALALAMGLALNVISHSVHQMSVLGHPSEEDALAVPVESSKPKPIVSRRVSDLKDLLMYFMIGEQSLELGATDWAKNVMRNLYRHFPDALTPAESVLRDILSRRIDASPNRWSQDFEKIGRMTVLLEELEMALTRWDFVAMAGLAEGLTALDLPTKRYPLAGLWIDIAEIINATLKPDLSHADRLAQSLGKTGMTHIERHGLFYPYYEQILFSFVSSYWVWRKQGSLSGDGLTHIPLLWHVLKHVDHWKLDLDEISYWVEKMAHGHPIDRIIKEVISGGMDRSNANILGWRIKFLRGYASVSVTSSQGGAQMKGQGFAQTNLLIGLAVASMGLLTLPLLFGPDVLRILGPWGLVGLGYGINLAKAVPPSGQPPQQLPVLLGQGARWEKFLREDSFRRTQS